MSQRLPVIGNEPDFEAEVVGARGFVLAGFWADWSGACHVMTPVIEAVARELEGRMKVVLVDIDRAPGLKTRFCVESVPALLFFHRGQLLERVPGTIPRKTLVEKAESHLGGSAAEES